MNDIPPYKEGFVTIQLHKKDLETLIELLNVTTQTYQNVIASARDLNDAKSVDTYTVRAKLSSMFCEVLSEQTVIAEPESRESH